MNSDRKKGAIDRVLCAETGTSKHRFFSHSGAVNKPISSSRRSFLLKSGVLLQTPCFWVSWLENRLLFRAACQLKCGCFVGVC